MTSDKTLEELARQFCTEYYPAEFAAYGETFLRPLINFATRATAAQQREVDFRDSQIEMLQTQLRTEGERVKELVMASAQVRLRVLAHWPAAINFSEWQRMTTALEAHRHLLSTTALSHSGKEGA